MSSDNASNFLLFDAPGHLIRRVQQIHVRVFDEMIDDATLTSPQFAILVVVYQNEDVDQITLSSLIAIDRSTIADVLRRLEQRGLISRTRDPNDSRKKRVRLTKLGRTQTEELIQKITNVGEDLLTPLDSEERKNFISLLTKIVAHHDPTFPPY